MYIVILLSVTNEDMIPMFKCLMAKYFGILSIAELLASMGLEPLTRSPTEYIYYQLFLQVKK